MTITAAAARRILRRQGMPPQEIRAVLAADDPLVVRRLLELHRERLDEWLAEQQRLLASIERGPRVRTEVLTSSMPIDTPC
jgi:DNA-binding transcriptional MerR regulator